MRLSKEFDVTATRERSGKVLAEDATLTSLFPDTKTEIVARKGKRRTTKSVYKLLGQEGEATFHFANLPIGTHTLSLQYSGDARYKATTQSIRIQEDKRRSARH